MKNFLFVFVVLSFSHLFGQNDPHPISKIEYLDSNLLGRKINKAIKVLGLDSNWRLIQEPKAIIQGIWSEEIEGYEVQLIIERISLGKLRKSKKEKILDRSKIGKYKIVGISWTSGKRCRSIGKVLPQYAYGRFGDCD